SACSNTSRIVAASDVPAKTPHFSASLPALSARPVENLRRNWGRPGVRVDRRNGCWRGGVAPTHGDGDRERAERAPRQPPLVDALGPLPQPVDGRRWDDGLER